MTANQFPAPQDESTPNATATRSSRPRTPRSPILMLKCRWPRYRGAPESAATVYIPQLPRPPRAPGGPLHRRGRCRQRGAAETLDGQTPGAALAAWLHRFCAFTASKRHIAAELLRQTDRGNPLFENSPTRVITAARPLLAAAQHVGEVRADLALEQILDMIVGIAAIHGETGYPGPILQAALDGPRVQAISAGSPWEPLVVAVVAVS